MMRDLRELYEHDGVSGVIGMGLFFWWAVQGEYAIVRFGVRALRALI